MDKHKMNETDKILNLSNPSTIAVVLMDLQPRLLQAIPGGDQLISANSILLQSAKLLKLPVLVTEQVPEKLGATDSSLREKMDPSFVFAKNSFSAFGCSPFTDQISHLGIDHLILAGIELPICIYLTAFDALRRNLQVTILSDCVSCRRPQDGEVALGELSRLGATVVALETFLYQSLESSEHTSFRMISEMIRGR